MVSHDDLDALDDDKAFFRFLHPRERSQLQGLPESIYDNLPTDACAIKAAGNAYPVPLLIAHMHGIINAIHGASVDLMSWPGNIDA